MNESQKTRGRKADCTSRIKQKRRAGAVDHRCLFGKNILTGNTDCVLGYARTHRTLASLLDGWQKTSEAYLLTNNLFTYLCICACVCAHVYAHHLCAGTFRGQRASDPWSWSYKQLCAQHECWNPSLGPLEEQALLAPEPFSSPLFNSLNK